MVRKLNIIRDMRPRSFPSAFVDHRADADRAAFLGMLSRLAPGDRRIVSALLMRVADLAPSEAIALIDEIELIISTPEG